jgi:hypothetical protein
MPSENPFLSKQFPKLELEGDVKKAARIQRSRETKRELETGEKPTKKKKDPESVISQYLERYEDFLNPKDKTKKERRLEAFRSLVYKNLVIKKEVIVPAKQIPRFLISCMRD